MSENYTRYNTVHNNTQASKIINSLPEDDSDLVLHSSVKSEEELLFGLLTKLRSERVDSYYGEIYSKILDPGPIQANYKSAALYTAHTPVDNKTRFYLQLTLLRYIITYGRDFKCFTLGEFSYALHEYAFRIAGNKATIGLLPWAFLESADVTIANKVGLPFGDWAIVTAIEQLNPPNGKISKAGLLIRQYIDCTSQLWRPALQHGWDLFE